MINLAKLLDSATLGCGRRDPETISGCMSDMPSIFRLAQPEKEMCVPNSDLIFLPYDAG